MSVEENKAMARRWNDTVWTGDIETFGEMLHEKYKNRSGTDEPWASTIDGLAHAKERFSELRTSRPTFRAETVDVIGEGDKVAVRMIFHEEGKPIANAIAMFRMEDGKIIDDWFVSRYLKSESNQ